MREKEMREKGGNMISVITVPESGISTKLHIQNLMKAQNQTGNNEIQFKTIFSISLFVRFLF